MSDTNEVQAAGDLESQLSAGAVPDLRVEPQYGPSGSALRRYSADGRFLLADDKLYDASSLATLRRDAGEQFTFNETAIRKDLIVRNIETWEIVADFTEMFKDEHVTKALMSEDGTYLAWYGWQGDRLVIVESATHRIIFETQLDGASMKALEFTADNEELWVWYYAGGGVTKLAVISPATGELTERTEGGKGVGFFESWTANRAGFVVLQSSLEKAPDSGLDAHRTFLIVQDRETGTPIATLCRPAESDLTANLVGWGDRTAQFSHDGALFAVLIAHSESGVSGFVCEAVLFETASWKKVRRLKLNPYNPWFDRPQLAFSVDGRRLQVGHEEYDLVGGALIRSFANTIDRPLLARSRKPTTTAVVRVHQDGTIATWSLLEGRQTATARLAGTFLALSDDGALVASFCEDYLKDRPTKRGYGLSLFKSAAAEFERNAGRSGDAVVIQDTATGRVTAALPTPYSDLKAIAFTPDSKTLLAEHWSMGPGMEVFHLAWNLESASLRWITKPGFNNEQKITVSPDSRLYVRWQPISRGVRVFDVETGNKLWEFTIENPYNSPVISAICFDPGRPNLIVCPNLSDETTVFNLVTGERSALPFRSQTLIFSPRADLVAWGGGIRRWGTDTDIVKSWAAGGVGGVFRGDFFYGCFWVDPKHFDTVAYYRLSDGELLGGWKCGFAIDEVRIVDAVQAGKPATLIALSDRHATVWGDGPSPKGLAIEFLPDGALLRNGTSQTSWTAEAIPHLRAYSGTREIPLGEFLQRTRSAAAAPQMEA